MKIPTPRFAALTAAALAALAFQAAPAAAQSIEP